MQLRNAVITMAMGICTLSCIARADKELEIIEVTAQKKVESLQDVPIAITAIHTDVINRFDLHQASEISLFVPNLNTTRSISGIQNYFIRGIGLDDFNLSSVSAVGLYIDDVAIQNPMLAQFTLMDINRAEVLRGPQNTLYGKNTTGGAIKFISNQPQFDNEHDGYAKVSLGQFNRRFVDISSNFAISNNSAARVSAFYHQADGEYVSHHDSHGTEYNNTDRRGVKLTLRHKVNDALELTGSLLTAEQAQITPVKIIMAGTEESPIIDLDTINFEQVYSPLVQPRNDLSLFSGYGKLTWLLDDYKLVAISAFEQVKSERMDDWGPQGLPSGVSEVITYNSTDTQNVSHELQLHAIEEPSNWFIGASYNVDTGRLAQAALIDPATLGRPDDTIQDPGGGPLFDRASNIHADTKTWSLYGNYQHAISADSRLTTGVRYSQQNLQPLVESAGMMMDDPSEPFPLGTFGWYSLGNPNFDVTTDYVGFNVLDNFMAANGGSSASRQIKETFSQWGAKLTYDYQLSDDTMWYLSLSRGFKMGAVNSNPSSTTFNRLLDNVVAPETLLTKELGWKTQLLDNRLRFNGAIFQNTWQDYQFFLVYNPGNPAALFASLVNLPEARSQGIEFETHWLASENFEINAGIALLDTEVTDATLDASVVAESQRADFQNQVKNGDELTNAPKLSANITFNHTVEFANSELVTLYHLNYKSEHTHMLTGDHSDAWVANFSEQDTLIANLSLSYEFGEMRQYNVLLWVKNLFAEKYCSERAAIPGTNTELLRLCSPGQPKTAGLTIKYRFD